MRLSLAMCIVAVAGCTPPASPALTRHPVPNASAALPSWFTGAWTREWIDRKGTRSDLYDVRYIQTPTLFADLRIPRDRPQLSHAASFADLTDADLRVLARQRAFAGVTTLSGELATWHHELDFQPSDSSPDIGRLERLDDAHMYEHATDGSYIESWRSLGSGDGKFLALRVERAGRLDRLLLVSGDHFFYVRNRRADLPHAESLDSLIATTRATRAQIIELLDCEFSAGRVRSGAIPWEVQRSTLPWREGKRLDFVDEVIASDAGHPLASAPSADRWSMPVNTFSHAERIALFQSR
jgi:hypothetical protein